MPIVTDETPGFQMDFATAAGARGTCPRGKSKTIS